MLVVGHRVHAVEGMGDVDEAALAPDLGDGLGQRHAARDLLLDEEADHLALAGGLDLLADDDLDAEALGLLARLERAGDLVVIGDGDRAQALLARGRQQHLDRRGAVAAVVRVHVQVDVDERAVAQAPAHGRVAAPVVAPRRDARVDLLQLARHATPGQPGAHGRARLAERRAQRGVAHDPPERRRERVGVAHLEQEAALLVAGHLLVGGQPAGHRNDARADGPQHQARRRDGALGGRYQDVGAGQQIGLGPPSRLGEAHAPAQLLAQRGARRGPACAEDRRLPFQRRVHAPQRAHEEAQGGTLLLVDEGDPDGAAVRRRGALERVGARQHDAVVAGEEAAHEVARGGEARQPRVEAPEDELDDLARDLRGDDALGRRVERPDVQRSRVAQRGARDARRERLVDVADVQHVLFEQRLDRARGVDRHRRPRAPRQRRQRLPDGQHPRLSPGAEQRVAAGAHGPAALAHELLGSGRRDDEHPVSPGGQLGRHASHVLVDLVGGLPWVRRHVGDGEWAGHRLQR